MGKLGKVETRRRMRESPLSFATIEMRVRMSRKRTATRKKKLVWLVAGVGVVTGGFTAATGAGFASQNGTAADGSGATAERTFRASVVDGVQIYACTQQADGTFAFTQRGVRATLEGGIQHSFVNPDSGPPQWVAADGSAVTGSVTSKTPHGPGNIPELELNATQSGESTGELSDVVKIRRLNTSGGVAPTGSCDPEQTPTTEVPYNADYEFVCQSRDTPGEDASDSPGEEASDTPAGEAPEPPEDSES
ncbi:DUF3455 domain-containing protein [Streptomyces sp. NPDC005209]|uniref:DUF3455 domain-containing protein n=1 Tax=Streptomyces sp. NPDC005209 TaxID=3156715 RepID=UPI0033B89FDC